MRYLYSFLLSPLLFLATFATAQAASFDIVSSASLTSTVYHMLHHEISGTDYLIVAAGEDGVLIYKVTDSGIAATPTATISTNGTAQDVAVSGNTLYIADGSSGSGLNTKGHVLFYNIASPASPQLLYDYSLTFGAFQTVEVSDSGTILFAGDKLTGVYVIDVSNTTAPTVLSTYGDGLAAVDLDATGTKLYIAQSIAEGEIGYLYVVDFTTPSAPASLGGGSISYNTNELTVDGNFVYLASGAEGLQIYDYSSPTNPSLLGTYDSDGSLNGFTAITGTTLAAVADGSGGVDMISLESSSAPTLVAESSSDQTQLNTAVDAVIIDQRLFVLSAGIYELELQYDFTVTGSDSGEKQVIAVIEGGDIWCRIAVADGTLGAQAFLADVNGDGNALDIVTAPVDKTKKPRLRIFDALSCSLQSEKKLSDSDQKQQFVLGVGNYYSDTKTSEIIAARPFEKDGANQLALFAYFVKADNSISKKANVTENPTSNEFIQENIKVKFKTDKSYPIIIQAKTTTDVKVKYQLKKKSDGSFILKKKEA